MENLANLAIHAFAINKKLEGLLVVGSEGGDSCSERTQRKTQQTCALARVAAYVCARGKHR